jgi:hypothetical protein
MGLHTWHTVLKAVSVVYLVAGLATLLIAFVGLFFFADGLAAGLGTLFLPLVAIDQGWFLFALYLIIAVLFIIGGISGLRGVINVARCASVVLVVAEALNLVSVYLSFKNVLWTLVALIGLLFVVIYLFGTRHARYDGAY